MSEDFRTSDGLVRSGAPSDFMGTLTDAIRQNPVPAALVGIGILWLFAGGRNVVLGGATRSVVSGIGHGAQDAGGAAYRGAREVTGRVRDGIHAAAESLSQVGAQATGAIGSAAETIGNAVNGTGAAVREASHVATGWLQGGGDTGERAQSNHAGGIRRAQDALADLFARQPLMLGAMGVAIGAAIAASLPVSGSEKRLMGETADVVKNQAGKLWDETKRRGADLASKGLQEAEAQGLTPEAAARAARSVATKVAGFAGKAGTDIVDRTRR